MANLENEKEVKDLGVAVEQVGEPTTPTEGVVVPAEEGAGVDINALLEQATTKEREYKRLLKKFTQTTQELADAKEDRAIMNYIRSNKDLTEQVNILMETFPGSTESPQTNVIGEAELKEYAEAWKYLAKQEDFDKNEAEIIEIAEEEGLNPDNPKDLKKAYRIWKGENAEKLAQSALMRGQKKSEQKAEDKKVPPLQGAGGAGAPAPLDYVNMSAQEVLKALGKKILKEK